MAAGWHRLKNVAPFSRRLLLAWPGLSIVGAGGRPRVACVLNAYYPNSHADVFIGRLLDGYRLNHQWHEPPLEIVSFYVDQFPANDMAREQAEEHGIRICQTVAEAVRGADAVAVIGEHGDYPRTERGNFMYPRWRYFDEIMRVMREERRVMPMYQDKYLAYDCADAKRMYDRVREMKIPFMCGSTVPLSWQRPPIGIARGVRLSELLTTSYSDVEEHSYHAIELLQSIAERRAGGETGVARVRWCNGEEVGKQAPRDLVEAALARRVNVVPENKQAPEALLIEYRDGLRGFVLHLNALTRDYLLAARLKDHGEVVSTCFYIELNLHNHWGFMVRNFEDLVLTRREPNPIERTLIANGIMLAGLESRRLGGQWIDTPELAIAYS